jgi:tetratricopeptide (TPR) repeat protein
MNKITVTIFACLIMTARAGAVPDSETWNEANSAYDNAQFADAIQKYSQLLERGNRSPAIYYNLGNAYFKNNQIGLAIAAYRNCLKFDPSFAAARENLEYVRKFTVDKVEERPKGFLINIWEGLTELLSPANYFIATIIIYWCLCAVVTLFIARIGKREILTYLLIFLAVIFILGVGLTRFVVDQELNTKWGVLTAASADLREGPGEDFEKIFTGHEGLEFKILSQRQDYYLVELLSGLRGWIPTTTLAEI